ncbi:TonB-dependent receptor [Shewanella sp. NIFS-20-20]|uniref:TonB-dependent receptor family protein n=1 Tax=Shewanella sp. NIFS-20-20 TaxID=2853806 RepID=UPI001C483457|nr:TonB-dependent receptor [Shewanella sp. NIFS-20-20]MBV7315986.1 TonB-dependent receptor [Shewanella sp. NIFS-20-20]
MKYTQATPIAALLGLILCGQSFADSRDPEHILVLGRADSDVMSMAANVQVLDELAIANSGASNLTDLLRGINGIQISDNNTQATIAMRGFTGAQAASNTLILVDGRRLNNIDIAAPALRAIPLSLVQSIEVLSGSAGVLYGDQAVGGVINIITRQPENTGATLQLGGGSFDSYQAQGDAYGRINQAWSYYGSANYHESDNYRDHNDSQTGSVLARINYDSSATHFYAEASYFDNKVQSPGALTLAQFLHDPRQAADPASQDYQHDMTQAWRMGASHQLTSIWALSADLDYSDSLVTSMNWGSRGRNERSLLSVMPKALASFPTEHGAMTVIVGGDFSRGTSAFSFGRENTQTVSSGYVQATVPLSSRISYVVGGRYAEARDRLFDDNVYPDGVDLSQDATAFELGLNYRPSAAQRWYVRMDDNFRFAKVDEQAYTPKGITGLKPQTGRSYEAGVDWIYTDFNVGLNIYRLDLEDEIIFDNDPALTPDGGPFSGANINAEASRRYGVNSRLGWQMAFDMELIAEYQYIDASLTAGENQGKRLSWVAPHSGRLQLSQTLGDHWQWQVETIVNSSRFVEGDSANLGDKLPGYGLVNFATNYYRDHWRLGLRIDNLLDKQYVAASYYSEYGNGYYSGSGRNVQLTLQYQF